MGSLLCTAITVINENVRAGSTRLERAKRAIKVKPHAALVLKCDSPTPQPQKYKDWHYLCIHCTGTAGVCNNHLRVKSSLVLGLRYLANKSSRYVASRSTIPAPCRNHVILLVFYI
jgi:hypothetical protein